MSHHVKIMDEQQWLHARIAELEAERKTYHDNQWRQLQEMTAERDRLKTEMNNLEAEALALASDKKLLEEENVRLKTERDSLSLLLRDNERVHNEAEQSSDDGPLILSFIGHNDP